MREIKFRAWNKTANRYSKPFGLNQTVVNYTDDDGLGVIKSLTHEVIEQYTGLKDKNGIEIYEGNIVSDGKRKYSIEWDQQNTSFNMNPIIDNAEDFIMMVCNYQRLGNGYLSRKDLEVIGNIHETNLVK